MFCKIFFAEQFDALRRNCGVADRYVESLSRCIKWDSKGGKTKSVFLKTQDERFVLKALAPIETAAFIKFAPAYFQFMAEAFFHEVSFGCGAHRRVMVTDEQISFRLLLPRCWDSTRS